MFLKLQRLIKNLRIKAASKIHRGCKLYPIKASSRFEKECAFIEKGAGWALFDNRSTDHLRDLQ